MMHGMATSMSGMHSNSSKRFCGALHGFICSSDRKVVVTRILKISGQSRFMSCFTPPRRAQNVQCSA